MKKTYDTPKIVLSGEVVRDTLSGAIPGCESDAQTVKLDDCAGSVGYYL
jgi:hypothetical protein